MTRYVITYALVPALLFLTASVVLMVASMFWPKSEHNLDPGPPYERAHRLIQESGCVQAGILGAREMNCVLEHYGYTERVVPGELVDRSMRLLEAHE